VQQFIELNATGFAKALKKWDKRSKSQTKELYLSRQVEGTAQLLVPKLTVT
jgi:CDK inhibitor PHO81